MKIEITPLELNKLVNQVQDLQVILTDITNFLTEISSQRFAVSEGNNPEGIPRPEFQNETSCNFGHDNCPGHI